MWVTAVAAATGWALTSTPALSSTTPQPRHAATIHQAKPANEHSAAVQESTANRRVARTSVPASTSDSLYVGDNLDNSVKQFDAASGQYLGVFVPPAAGLHGPRGILHLSDGRFLVANQNVDLPVPGEIDQFDSVGKSLGALVPSSDPNAPFAPRGIILGPDKSALYVADVGENKIGAVEKYNVHSGKFLGKLNFDEWVNSSASNGEFHPRGLVFGPHGLLYVSAASMIDPTLGWILSYNTRTGAIRVVASESGATNDCNMKLHRPEGLTFGPDGRLYVTSFRADSSDIDRILSYTATGGCVDEIDLDQVGQPRASAQHILFGPSGHLFVPITGLPPNPGPNAGAVRQYDVSTKTFTNFVAPGGPLLSGWGLTFGRTNPTTLAYCPPDV